MSEKPIVVADTMQLWLRIPLVSPEMEGAQGTENEDALFLVRTPSY